MKQELILIKVGELLNKKSGKYPKSHKSQNQAVCGKV